MSSYLTIEQLENMKTHDLADLLANIVMVLRRIPDVPCKGLQPSLDIAQEPATTTTASRKHTHIVEEQVSIPSDTSFSSEELKKKTVPELKKIASTLHVLVSAKAKKDELVSKILAKQEHSHSEQFAIQNI